MPPPPRFIGAVPRGSAPAVVAIVVAVIAAGTPVIALALAGATVAGAVTGDIAIAALVAIDAGVPLAAAVITVAAVAVPVIDTVPESGAGMDIDAATGRVAVAATVGAIVVLVAAVSPPHAARSRGNTQQTATNPRDRRAAGRVDTDTIAIPFVCTANNAGAVKLRIVGRLNIGRSIHRDVNRAVSLI